MTSAWIGRCAFARSFAVTLVALCALTGCGGNAFSAAERNASDAEPGDSGGAESETGDAGGEAETTTHPDAGHDAAPEAADAAPDAPNETTPESDAAPEATPDAHPEAEAGLPICSCGSTSCWYSINEPTSGSGAPYSVTTIVLTPSDTTAHVTATITTPPTPDHNAVWYDLDVSAFPSGATLSISGVMGSTGTDGSAFLITQCDVFPTSGAFTPAAPGANVGNVAPSATWSFTDYTFAAGTTVLHLGTEGSWYNAGICPNCTAGATNTNMITVNVHP